MEVGYYSVEASVIENGKTIKGTLTLFYDEYAFGSTRRTVDWEKVMCEKSTASIKTIFRTVEKPCVSFRKAPYSCPCFILEQEQMNTFQKAVNGYIQSAKKARANKEKADAETAKKRELEKKQKIDKERRLRQEAQHRVEEARRQKEEATRQAHEAYEIRMKYKKERIQKEVDAVKQQPMQDTLDLDSLAKKAGSAFLDNPYRILGISCCATNEEANTALDKLKKLARLKAIGSYNSPFDLIGIEKPIRELSVAQNALTLLTLKS